MCYLFPSISPTIPYQRKRICAPTQPEDLTPGMQDLTVDLWLNDKNRGTLSVKDALQHISAERESLKR